MNDHACILIWDAHTRMGHNIGPYAYGTSHTRMGRPIRVWACHSINGPGISGPGGPFMFDINGPPGPFMLSQMVPLDHLCQNINGPGKT